MYFGLFDFDIYFSYGLYMLEGDFLCLLFLCFYISCFTLWYIDYDLYYEVIHGICLFILCFVKSRNLI